MRDYLLTMLVAAAVTYVVTPLVRRFAAAIGAIKVEMRERDVHTAPVPLIGGLAMYVGLAAALLVADEIPQLHDAIANTGMVVGLLAAGGLLVVIGMIDDRWGMSALTKAAGQVAAAGIIVATGTQLSWLPLPGGNGRIFVPTPDQQTVLTILIVVATINAVNFIDGLDGLAAGIVAIAATSFFAYYYSLTKLADISSLAAPALASAVLIGICLGFLPHNFAPAKIFMGDTGSMLLGLVLAYAPIASINSLDPAQLTSSINRYPVIMPLLLPALLLVIPYGDMLLAVVRRTRAGQSPFAADRKHLHHRLLDFGHSQRASVLIMYLWAAAFSGTVVWLSITKTEQPRAVNHHGEPVIVFVLITVAAVAILLVLSMPWRHWGERARAARSPAVAATGQGPGIAAGATAQQPARSGASELVATGAAARYSGALLTTSGERLAADRAGGASQPADTQPGARADGDARPGQAEPEPDGANGHRGSASARYTGSAPGDTGRPSRGAEDSGADDSGADASIGLPEEEDVWPAGGAAADNGFRRADRWQASDEGLGNAGGYEADRWPDGDEDDPGNLPRYEADRWPGGDEDDPGDLPRYQADRWPDGDEDPGNLPRYEADRWPGGAEDPGDLPRYQADRWPGGEAGESNGWLHGRHAGLDGADSGLEAGVDRGHDEDRAHDEPADGDPGRSVVGTLPPASDWSWFGSSASSNPGSRDH